VLRSDDEPVDPGTGKTPGSIALARALYVFGTSFADFIMASGLCGRTNRPDTWMQPIARNHTCNTSHCRGRPYMLPLEFLVECYGAGIVAEKIGEDRERQLRRA